MEGQEKRWGLHVHELDGAAVAHEVAVRLLDHRGILLALSLKLAAKTITKSK